MKFLFKLSLLAGVILGGSIPMSVAAQSCSAQVAQWLDPADGSAVMPAALFDRLVGKSIVLLGEVHDNPGHHRWQHYSLSALHSRHENLIVGLEMLPRKVQSVLDDWSAGKLDEAAFLERSEWEQLWGYDPQLYLPLLRFSRQHRLPTVALNVDRELVSRVGSEGWAAIEESERLGLSDPAPASDEYRRRLGELYAYKISISDDGDAAADQEIDVEATMQSDAFANFVDAQLTWDRAMAEALAAAHRREPEALIVGIVGRGHLEYGDGIPHQLADMGIDDVAVLLPVDADDDCAELPVDLADAVFVVEARSDIPPAPRPQLGVMIESGDDGVRVMEVVAGSVAEASGLRAGDIIRRAAGFDTATPSALIEVIQRQAPGTWLPLVVGRDDGELDVTARFPQRFE